MEKRNALAFIILLIVLAFFSRLILLDLRPLHHDEGVNYFFADNIADGRGWRYDPTNYHGPLYFFVLALSFLFLGVSELSLRLPAALFGIALAVLPLFLRFRGSVDEGGKYGKYWKYLASLFLLLSPSLLYYSRYSIHEASFVFFSFLGVYFLSLILERKDIHYLPHFAVVLALLFATKETVVILLLVLLVMVMVHWKSVRGIALGGNSGRIWFSVLLFAFVYALLFTNFFTYTQGIFDSFGAYLPWAARGIGEVGHDKPFFYYLLLMLKYELPLLLLGVLGLVVVWKRWRHDVGHDMKNRNDAFGWIFVRNIALWFFVTFFVYSFIPYKTPWLIVNMTAPLAVLAGFGLLEIFEKRGKFIALVILALSLIYLGYFSWLVNFSEPWQTSNDFAYVHTSGEVLKLVDAVEKTEGKILIVFNESSYWPLPFYFDQREVDYSTVDDLSREEYADLFLDYQILLVQDKVFREEELPEGYFSERHVLREGVGVVLVREE